MADLDERSLVSGMIIMFLSMDATWAVNRLRQPTFEMIWRLVNRWDVRERFIAEHISKAFGQKAGLRFYLQRTKCLKSW